MSAKVPLLLNGTDLTTLVDISSCSFAFKRRGKVAALEGPWQPAAEHLAKLSVSI